MKLGLLLATLFAVVLPSGFWRADETSIPGLPLAVQHTTNDLDEAHKLVRMIVADTELVWSTVFASVGKTYRYPQLVLFSGTAFSACGRGQGQAGPFYCPIDMRVYLDLSFFSELKSYFASIAAKKEGSEGALAFQDRPIPNQHAVLWAYAIAHEMGHHVQTLLGIEQKVTALEERLSQIERDRLSTLFELQADCLAGIWFSHIDKLKSRLEPGDLELALTGAAAVGADALLKQAGATEMPDSFTHGTSAERAYWLKRGFESGEIKQCNTFDQRPHVPHLAPASPDRPKQ